MDAFTVHSNRNMMKNREEYDKNNIFTKSFQSNLDTDSGLQNENPPLIPAILTYLKTGRYLGTVPFQTSYNNSERCWRLRRSKLRLFLCAIIMWIPYLLHECLMDTSLIIQFSNSGKRTAKSYFKLWYNLLNTVRGTLFTWTLITKYREIESFLNFCTNVLISLGNPTQKSTSGINRKHVAAWAELYFKLMVCIYFVILFVEIVFSYESGKPLQHPLEVLKARMVDARESLFFMLPSKPISKYDSISAEDIVLCIVYTWFNMATNFLNFSAEAFLLGAYPLFLWVMTRRFEMHFQQITVKQLAYTPNTLESLIQNYENLKTLSSMMNKLWGKIELMIIVEMLFRAIFVFDGNGEEEAAEVSHKTGPILLLILGILVLIGIIALILAADVFTKMDNFRDWLTTRRNWTILCTPENKSEIERIVLELGSNPVGVAYGGVYKCTYGFLAQLLAIIITVFTVSFDGN